ncbi:hypothetical protein [Chryseobacterium hagamense]|uniref:Transposase IS200-like domain-containing protein n=1 Tax=Chryseobacterium hagamense TaxID=395935 RepID=A0A511YNF0_9FLAO|nr:hypothetical protein [Chryseobacterium hagamense]GEN76686.1 hypothetical protein CHA01nite_24260 [Chryseobacterium hagamense]
MKIRESHLESGCFYPIFNRGVNSKMVFLSDENCSFFLRKVKLYLIPYFDIYAYCLMPNHFHLLLKVKSGIEEVSSFKDRGLHSEECFFSKQIGRLISSYTQAFNKVYRRSGPVFESPFKRIRIDSEEYLRNLVIYIHQNPENFQNYKFSSYLAVLSETRTLLLRNEVMEWFGDRENFIACHRKEFNGHFVRDIEL